MEISIIYMVIALCSLSTTAYPFHVNNINKVFSYREWKTATSVSIPRCGFQDSITLQGVNQYKLKGGKWNSSHLTFAIENYPGDDLSEEDVVNEITRAFKIWSKYTNLTFVLTNFTKKANFKFKFVNGSHGDEFPFDGPGNVLAHSFSPNSNKRGQIHFDVTEKWTVKSYKGINLFQNAAHEIGHTLGLDHSPLNSSLMSAYYQGYNKSFETNLSNDDIDGIQVLYGIKESSNNDERNNYKPQEYYLNRYERQNIFKKSKKRSPTALFSKRLNKYMKTVLYKLYK